MILRVTNSLGLLDCIAQLSRQRPRLPPVDVQAWPACSEIGVSISGFVRGVKVAEVLFDILDDELCARCPARAEPFFSIYIYQKNDGHGQKSSRFWIVTNPHRC